ncbi:MAG: hypothetical protein AB8G99_08070, partial [Planctomycetaceae bacterium]
MNADQLENALSNGDTGQLAKALDDLYGPERIFEEPATPIRSNRTRWGVLIATACLLTASFSLWTSAAASGERSEISRTMASVPDFFASVEDEADRSELLAETLMSLPRPEYPRNRALWNKSMLRVNGLLALQASRGGRWQLSQVYEQEAREFLNALDEPDIHSRCVVEYSECRRRHEQA